jgi:hypothetical protein
MKKTYIEPDGAGMDFGWEGMKSHEMLSRETMDNVFRNYYENEMGKVAPDTTGADYFFLYDFITEDMRLDFSLIEQEFLKHCMGRLREFDEAGWYGGDEWWYDSPKDALHKRIFRLMYNGAKLGDAYCVELLRYLYKTFHRKEYNQLKRFTKMSGREVYGLSVNEYDNADYGIMGRILGMCQFFQIKIEDDCAFIYILLNRARKDWIEEDEARRECKYFEKGLLDECMQQVEAWQEEKKNSSRSHHNDYRVYFKESDFIGDCLKQYGYPGDYVYFCMEHNAGWNTKLAQTLAVLKMWDPKREFTFEDVQRYMAVYETVGALVDVTECFDYESGYLIGDLIDDYDRDEMLFKPENIVVKDNSPAPGQSVPKPKILTNIAPVSMGKASTDDYLQEIADLRKKINEKEQENNMLREQYRQAKRAMEESDELVRKYQSERDELVALRDFAYRTRQEMPPIPEKKLDDMVNVIAGKNIAVIGGHVNWVNKLKQQFPNWMYVLPDAYKTVNGKMLEGKDKVYFFTDHISHVTYGKFIAEVRERKIPFGYIACQNMEQLIEQVYEDMAEI